MMNDDACKYVVFSETNVKLQTNHRAIKKIGLHDKLENLSVHQT